MKQCGNIIIDFIKNQFVFVFFLLILIGFVIAEPSKIPQYPSFVHWQTITTLTGLLIIVNGLKESGYFGALARLLTKTIKTEKYLALWMIVFSAIMAAFLTNDISLFIVVPLTLSMQDSVKNDIKKLVIFEAMAANIGSLLMPIGNPQNIFLWHQWQVSFLTFVQKMFPLFVLLLVLLLIFAILIFPSKKIVISHNHSKFFLNKSLFLVSILWLIIYIVLMDWHKAQLALIFIIIFYLIFFYRILFRIDWMLLLLFIVIFIDFQLITDLPVMWSFVKDLNLHSQGGIFLFSALVSQIISNVPASVFVSKFFHSWQAILFGVNVGGNGWVIASLANIIALRMVKEKYIWWEFHKYSLVYFFISLLIVWLLFYG